MKTRLSDIVSHLLLRNNCRQIVTQQLQKIFFYNVILKCFQNHCHLLSSQKETKAFFQSEPEIFPFFELNYKFLERHKKTSFPRDNEKARKSCEHGPERYKVQIKLSKIQTCTTDFASRSLTR